MYRLIFRLVFVFSVLSPLAIAQAKNANPHFQYHFGYIRLFGQGTRIYIFQNISKKLVLLNRYLRFDPGVSAGWATELLPGRWSAILLDQSPFTLTCQFKQGIDYRKISCKHVIKVWPISSFSSSNKQRPLGSYWIAENKTCQGLRRRVKDRGFRLIFPPC